jgi:hypothetical protein
MKTLIKISPASFILGAVFGGLAIFTMGADTHRPTDWNYRVVEEDIKYFQKDYCADVINKAATNSWEFVSAQIIPNPPGDIFDGAKVIIIQRQAKQ